MFKTKYQKKKKNEENVIRSDLRGSTDSAQVFIFKDESEKNELNQNSQIEKSTFNLPGKLASFSFRP